MNSGEMLESARKTAIAGLAQPGDWLSGRQRLAVWSEVRDAAENPLDQARRGAISPSAVEGHHGPSELLSGTAREVIHRVASDPGRLTQAWAVAQIGDLGEETYTELVGVTAIVTVLDRFDEILGRALPPLPTPGGGEPARERPDGVGDVGAWVSQTIEKERANVSRSLSLVPVTQSVWGALVSAHYSRGLEFYDLTWDRNLSRPQVELLAARTTVVNECFY